jgi:pimeloyl-ACP methyl ester carboxylesterase
MSTVRRDGIDIYYEVHGSGPSLLLMGGWGSYGHGDLREVPRALRDGYRLLLVDYRGIGGSGDDAGPASMTRLAADAIAVLEAADAGPTHVVGVVGMGGCIAQQIAITRPDLVRSLVLSGTWAAPDRAFADLLTGLLDLHRDSGFAAFQRMCAALSFAPDFYAEHAERICGPTGAWSDLAGRIDTHRRLTEACLSHDVTQRLAEVTVPSLVIHAGADVITPPRLTRRLSALLPGSRDYEWPELAHVVAGRDARARFDRILADFLASVP